MSRFCFAGETKTKITKFIISVIDYRTKSSRFPCSFSQYNWPNKARYKARSSHFCVFSAWHCFCAKSPSSRHYVTGVFCTKMDFLKWFLLHSGEVNTVISNTRTWLILYSLSGWMMTCSFTAFSTVSPSYQAIWRAIMYGSNKLTLTCHENHPSKAFNPIALRKAKIAYNVGLSECNRVKWATAYAYGKLSRNWQQVLPLSDTLENSLKFSLTLQRDQDEQRSQHTFLTGTFSLG